MSENLIRKYLNFPLILYLKLHFMEIIFATNNINKIKEIQSFINGKLSIKSLAECGITEDIPEPYFTFEENARAKAMYVYKKTGCSCFAEDSGIVVPALNGDPGVLSARYSGEHGNDKANNIKLLSNLNSINYRRAYYKAVICLVVNENEVYYFDGECWGSIAEQVQGDGGFGYDPLFIPEGYSDTFGVLGMEVKNQLSHRSKAVRKLVEYIDSKY
jgi:XTP/dITP diphosphohydrolase